MDVTTHISTCTCGATHTFTVAVPETYREAGKTFHKQVTECRECLPYFVVAQGYTHHFGDIFAALKFAQIFRVAVDATR